MANKLRVLLVDDHALVRADFAACWRTSHVSGRGEASDGLEAVELALELRPDVIVMGLCAARR